MALTAPLSHKWFLKSRKQMRAKAPFKVHLRCLKSIYTHILLRSLLYELLMNSTFCYPTFLIHRGKKKQTRKPMQAVWKQMHHSILYQKGWGGFWSRGAARHLCKEEKGNKKNKKLMVLHPQTCLSHTGHAYRISPQRLLQSKKQLFLSCSIISVGLVSSVPRADLWPEGAWVALSPAPKLSWQPRVSLARGPKENSRQIWYRKAWHETWTNQVHCKPDFIFQVENYRFLRTPVRFWLMMLWHRAFLPVKLNPDAS